MKRNNNNNEINSSPAVKFWQEEFDKATKKLNETERVLIKLSEEKIKEVFELQGNSVRNLEKLSQEQKTHQITLKQKKEEFTAINKELESLKSWRDQIEGALTKAENECRQVESKLYLAEKKIEAFRTVQGKASDSEKIERLQTQIDGLIKNLEEVTNEKNSLQVNLGDKEREIREFETKNNNLKEQIKNNKSTVDSLNKQIESIQKDLQDQLDTVSEKLKSEQKSHKSTKESLSTRLDDLNKEVESLQDKSKNDLKNSEEQRKNLEERINELDRRPTEEEHNRVLAELNENKMNLSKLRNIPLTGLNKTIYDWFFSFVRNVRPGITIGDIESKYPRGLNIKEAISKLSLEEIIPSSDILSSIAIIASLEEGLILSEEYLNPTNNLTSFKQVNGLIRNLKESSKNLRESQKNLKNIVDKKNHPFYLLDLEENGVDEILSKVQGKLIKLEQRSSELNQSASVVVPGRRNQ